MRFKFLGLAASSLLFIACGEETTSSQKTSLSDAQVLAMLGSSSSAVGMVGDLSGMATSSLAEMNGGAQAERAVVAARSADQCGEMLNTTTSFPDEETGETTTLTMRATLGNGSAITCENFDLTSGLKFSISMSSQSFSLAMDMTLTTLSTGGMSIVGSGSGTFSDEGVTGGFTDMAFTQTIDAEGEITAYTGSMKIQFDGASTDAIAFGAEGALPQTVKVYRNGGVIGTMTFAADGSVVVKDATGKIVSVESAEEV